MENKINIAKILKDCPKGMKLDCTVFENLEFDHIDKDNGTYPIICRVKTEWGSYNVHTFTVYGCYSTEKYSKCSIFPKGKTTWEGFQPFKDGDIISASYYDDICIFKDEGNIKGTVDFYCGISGNSDELLIKDVKNQDEHFGDIDEYKLATEEEKEKLFKVIKYNGYVWNEETKSLEKVIEPKFKVGDTITKIDGSRKGKILYIDVDRYYVAIPNDIGIDVFVEDQDEWELVHNKFDINTLKPFESKVLVRNSDNNDWCPAIFGCKLSAHTLYKYATMTENYYAQCIPYKDNEHLCGTANDCDNFYKTW